MDLYSSLTKMCLRIYQTATFQRRSVNGRDQLSPGAKIIAANHPNATDAYYFPFVLEGKFYALIAGTSFSRPVIGWVMTRCGQIPVQKDQKLKALDQACELLSKTSCSPTRRYTYNEFDNLLEVVLPGGTEGA